MLDGPWKYRLRGNLFPLSRLAVSGVFFIYLGLAGCQQSSPPPTQKGATISATASASPTLLPPASATLQDTVTSGPLPVWLTYAPPTLTPATAVPPPVTGLNLPAEVQVVALAGLDQDPPFVGRTMALSLLLYNPRLAKASLVTLPGDLYVYIPGYTMQRLNVAYSVGGLEMLFQTLQYNFDLRPSHWVFAHPSDFTRLIDDLGGLDVPVLVPLPDVCGGIMGGVVHMDGSLSLCYVSYRQSITDFDADQRQQLFLRLLFLRMVEGGNLVRLPSLFKDLQSVDTDLTLDDLMNNIPLALKLGDPQRVSYFQIAYNEVTPWQIPGKAKASVLLPRLPALQSLIQQAIDAVMVPAPLTDRVSTLVYELTISPTVTLTIPATPTGIPKSYNLRYAAPLSYHHADSHNHSDANHHPDTYTWPFTDAHFFLTATLTPTPSSTPTLTPAPGSSQTPTPTATETLPSL